MHQVPLSSNGSLDAEMLSEPDRYLLIVHSMH